MLKRQHHRSALLRHIACFCVVLAMPLASEAQGNSSQSMTMPEALKKAHENNYSLQKAKARVERLKGEEIHASRLVPSNPKVSFKAADREAPAQNYNDIGIEIRQEIWIAGQGGLAEDAASKRVESAQASLDFLATSVTARTRQAFLELLVARRAVDTAQKVLDMSGKLERYVQKRLASGEATQLEANNATIAVGKARARLVQAKKRQKQAKIRLTKRLGISPTRKIQVEGKLKPVKLEIEDQRRLLRKALKRRQDLVAAAKDVMAARQSLRLSRRELIPNLELFGFAEDEGPNEVVGGGVAMDLPVLHWRTGENKAARARLQKAQISRDALKLRVRREVLDALARYKAARKRVSVMSDKLLTRAEENVALTRKAFEAGRLGISDLTTMQNDLLDVRQSYLSALRDLISAGSALERATGGLVAMRAGNTATDDQQDSKDRSDSEGDQ